ncbi:hypothetical protein BDV98DRAFT_564021 [Pterulicium gracile]|uniref:Uncharacterized protein n=1 Tax=Pterulicium gracile TaxID=1884261 RepID=A0A5C3QND0_9AGAR|nr:hypothetical protein BDV98DRAFT_564021 [Pterula gracilis]
MLGQASALGPPLLLGFDDEVEQLYSLDVEMNTSMIRDGSRLNPAAHLVMEEQLDVRGEHEPMEGTFFLKAYLGYEVSFPDEPLPKVPDLGPPNVPPPSESPLEGFAPPKELSHLLPSQGGGFLKKQRVQALNMELTWMYVRLSFIALNIALMDV